MNSIKSLSVLFILIVVGGYLYLKINETEPILPPEAEGLSVEAPQIELDDVEASGGLAPRIADAAIPQSGLAATSEAPSWSPPATIVPPPVAAGPANTIPPLEPVTIAPAPSDSASGPTANPFDHPAHPTGGQTVGAPAVSSPGQIVPSGGGQAPPGALGAAPATIIEGRVYDNSENAQNATSPAATLPAASAVAGGAIPGAAGFASVSPTSAKSVLALVRPAVDALLAQREYARGLKLLSEYYRDPSLTESERQEVSTLLSQLAGSVIYSTQHLLEPPHVVQPGETLAQIAASYRAPAALLAKINGISDATPLQPGTQLKVLRGPFSAIVDLTYGDLTLMLGGRFAGRFPIHLGTDQPNPEGIWSVVEKRTDPAYQAGGQNFSGGDPANPLGGRLIVLQPPTGAPTGLFGIHGSREGGMNDPRGYIRLSATDAVDVFDILSIGSQVIVRR